MARNGHKGNGRGHVTETPDVSHIKNVDVTHERSDVDVGALLKFVGGLTLMTALVAVLMWGLFAFFQSRESRKERERPPGPMALTREERLPPEPRLQSAPGFGLKLENGQWVPLEKREPQAEYRALREQWERQLNCKQAEPGGHDTVAESGDHADKRVEASPAAPCMKIEDAIKRVIQEGLPARKDGAGMDPVLPTTASSGRQ